MFRVPTLIDEIEQRMQRCTLATARWTADDKPSRLFRRNQNAQRVPDHADHIQYPVKSRPGGY